MTLYADDGTAISKNWFHLTPEEFNGMSQVEILESTAMFRCGPHPPKVHVDEVELMDPETWEESLALEQGRDAPR